MKKIVFIFLISVVVMSLYVVTYAANDSDPINFAAADNFLEAGQQNSAIEDLTSIGDAFSTIGNILTYIGAGILVGATAYMGILYMISAPEKQAKLKEQLIGLVVSAVVIFGAYGIWKMITSALTGMVG